MRLFDSSHAFNEDYSNETMCDMSLTEKQLHIVSYVMAVAGGMLWAWTPALTDDEEAEFVAIIANILEVTCGE